MPWAQNRFYLRIRVSKSPARRLPQQFANRPLRLPLPPSYQSRGGSVPAANVGAAPETRGAALESLRLLAMEVSKGTVDLPCFPDVVVRIRHALANPSTTMEKTVAIVGNEPRLDRKSVV